MLWVYRTTSGRSIGETPFSLTFGTKAMILVEVGLSSMKVASFSPSTNDMIMA